MKGALPFEVEQKDVKQLDEYQLTLLVKKLLLSEISKVNLCQSAVTVSLDIKDPDGGLDGYIGIDIPPGNSWLPSGKSGWQCKAVDRFSANQAEKDVLNKTRTDLKPRIRKLLEEKGAYVLVLGKRDLNPAREKDFYDKIKTVFSKQGFDSVDVRIYGAGKIAGWSNAFPSVAALIKPDRISFKNMESWAELQSIKEPPSFFPDTKRKEQIDAIRTHIRLDYNGSKSGVFRVVGLSGIGKTRLVYEALKEDGLTHLVCYFDSPEKLPALRFNSIQQDKSTQAIFVVDECTHEKHTELAKEAEGIGGRFTLITLDYDIDPPRQGDSYIKLERLQEPALDELIKTTAPGLPENSRRRVVEWADGFPKMATMLAENFALHPNLLSPDTLNEIGAEELFDRMIAGRQDKNDQIVQDTKKVLRAIALFKRLGWEDDVEKQGQKVCELLKLGEWGNIKELIDRQVKRGLVVKRGRYLYVTPLPLAVHLASIWWKFVTQDAWINFINGLPDRESKMSFIDRLKDLQHIREGKKAIELLLGENGFFVNREVLDSDLGSQAFLYLAQGDHNAAMGVLDRLLGECSREELLRFEGGRRNVVWALEKIAWWPDTFHRAARLLLKLADAENETWSNNATGVFAGLFQPLLSGTAVPATERHIILKEALHSSNLNYQRLALRGVRSALNVGHVFRSCGAEYQGVITPPPEWQPKTVNELKDAVLSALTLLDFAFQQRETDICGEAINIFLSSARTLVNGGFREEVLERLYQIKNHAPDFRKEIIAVTEEILYYDRKELPPDIVNKLTQFREELIGKDFKSLLLRYAGQYLLEDRIEEIDSSAKPITTILRELAQKSMESPEKLEQEFNWLLSPEAENGYAFGMILGEIDTENAWLERMLKGLKCVANPSGMFVGGYLRSIRSRNEEKWESILDLIRDNADSQKMLLELTWRSGTSDRALRRILDMLKTGDLEPQQIKILEFGAWCKELSIGAFIEFLQEFFNIDEGNHCAMLLGTIHQFVESHADLFTLADNLLLCYLTHDSLLNNKDTMTWYHWSVLANKHFTIFRGSGEKFLNFIFRGLSEGDVYMRRDVFFQMLRHLFEKDVESTWHETSQALLRHDKLAWELNHALRGDYAHLQREKNALLDLIPEDLLLKWCDEHPAEAPGILAGTIPLHQREELHPVAVRLLTRYPQDKKVLSHLSMNWNSEGYSGPASLYLTKKLKTVKQWAQTSDTSVLEWVREEIKDLEKRIEIAKRHEEERGY